VGVLSALALVSGCASEVDDDAESDATQLSALETSIGFDGAMERLDEAALARVDSEAAAREARGDLPDSIERAASQRVLREAQTASTRPRSSALQLRSAYDSDLVKMNGQEKALCKSARLVCVRVLLAGFRARGASQSAYRDGNVGGRIAASPCEGKRQPKRLLHHEQAFGHQLAGEARGAPQDHVERSLALHANAVAGFGPHRTLRVHDRWPRD